MNNIFRKKPRIIFPFAKNGVGFTMVEILMVVAIMAILSTIMFAGSIQRSLEKGRDSKRKQDLAKMQRIMEDYYNDNQGYPPSTPNYQDGTINGAAWGGPFLPYAAALPQDPQYPYRTYFYQATSNREFYTIYAYMENKDDDDIERSGCKDGCGPNNKYNYAVYSSNVVMISGAPNGEIAILPPTATPTATVPPTATLPPPTATITPSPTSSIPTPTPCWRLAKICHPECSKSSVTQLILYSGCHPQPDATCGGNAWRDTNYTEQLYQRSSKLGVYYSDALCSVTAKYSVALTYSCDPGGAGKCYYFPAYNPFDVSTYQSFKSIEPSSACTTSGAGWINMSDSYVELSYSPKPRYKVDTPVMAYSFTGTCSADGTGKCYRAGAQIPYYTTDALTCSDICGSTGASYRSDTCTWNSFVPSPSPAFNPVPPSYYGICAENQCCGDRTCGTDPPYYTEPPSKASGAWCPPNTKCIFDINYGWECLNEPACP